MLPQQFIASPPESSSILLLLPSASMDLDYKITDKSYRSLWFKQFFNTQRFIFVPIQFKTIFTSH